MQSEIYVQYSQDKEPLSLVPRALPLVPELQLMLLPDALPTEKLGQSDFYTLLANPPYWAFCWGGGQALARYLLDHPGLVKGRRVWDFGAGSGVAAIAALLAGAGASVAVDIDPNAQHAALVNAQLNRVTAISAANECQPQSGDVVLAADICYEEQGLCKVREWVAQNVCVIVAESRLDSARLGLSGLQLMARYQIRTFPDLEESSRFDNVCIYQIKP